MTRHQTKQLILDEVRRRQKLISNTFIKAVTKATDMILANRDFERRYAEAVINPAYFGTLRIFPP